MGSVFVSDDGSTGAGAWRGRHFPGAVSRRSSPRGQQVAHPTEDEAGTEFSGNRLESLLIGNGVHARAMSSGDSVLSPRSGQAQTRAAEPAHTLSAPSRRLFAYAARARFMNRDHRSVATA